MDILIRNVNEHIVNKLDYLSKKNSYTSRNEFLRKKIEDIAYEKEQTQLEKDYIQIMNLLNESIKKHTNILSSFMDEFIIDAEDAYKLDLNFDDIKNKLNKESINLNTNKETSEIKVRDLPTNVICRIDEISKEKGVSRNDFLIKYLSQITYSNSLKLINEKYEYSIEKILGLLEFSNRVLTIFLKENFIDTSEFYESEDE